MNLEIQTTHAVISELNSTQREELRTYTDTGLLTIIQFNADEIQELLEYDLPKGLSPADRSVLFVAYKNNSMMLSGDMKLRKCCHSLGLNVHGILWLFDQFIESGRISFSIAVSKINGLMEYNRWLPMDECIKRIDLWNGEENKANLK
ncbi:MAG: hypothetical protein KKA07_03090 [Bacteroidetes bacterium]|nr:hypothetical protein [Bacteroidota bacterium]